MDVKTKDNLLEVIKKEWSKEIAICSDLKFLEVQSEKYLKILNELNALEILDEPKDEINEASKKEIIESDDEDIYTLKRRLLGGYGIRENSKNNVFVPESAIRNTGLEHGDKFKYIKDGLAKGRDAFIKLTDSPKDETIEPNDLVTYDYAVVEYDSDLKEYLCKKIHDEGEQKRIEHGRIHGNDVSKFKLKDGDIVSIARAEGQTTYRVRWLYDTDEYLIENKPKKPSFYKDKEPIAANNEFKENNDFENLVISIFGGDTFINNYTEEVEKRGGEVLYTASDISSRIESIVAQSHIVVIPIEHTSHAKAKAAKESAKKLNKPFVILHNNGRSYFVNEIKQAIENNKITPYTKLY